jgi:hypothetical protein
MKMTHATICLSTVNGIWSQTCTYLKDETRQEDVCSDIDCDTTFSWLFTSCHTKEGSTSQLDEDAKYIRSNKD